MGDYGTIKAARKSGEKPSIEDLKAALAAETARLAAADQKVAETETAFQAAHKADLTARGERTDARRHVSKLTRWLGQAEGTIPADAVHDPYHKPEELPGEVEDEPEDSDPYEGANEVDDFAY